MSKWRLWLPFVAMSINCCGWGTAWAGEFDRFDGEVYVQRESGPLKADLYIPRGEGPFPGVLVVHGGAWYTGTRAQLAGVCQQLAEHGFAAVAISYRLAPKHQFPAQIEDCKEAVRWMRSNAQRLKINAPAIGGFGYSAGAHLVALLGTSDAKSGMEGPDVAADEPSTRLQAVVGGGTPCDFRTVPLDTEKLSFWLGGSRRQQAERYRLASPAAFISADDPPMFFFHGEFDRLVPMVGPQAMCRELKAVGVPAELYIVPQVGHLLAAMNQQVIDKSIAFLGKQLRTGDEP